jgi:hypothetical protein
MRSACAIHRPKWYALFKTHQATPVLHRERYQVEIGELRMTMHLHGIEMGMAQQAERVRPELVVRGDVGFEPGGYSKMMNMVPVMQGNEYVDIQ